MKPPIWFLGLIFLKFLPTYVQGCLRVTILIYKYMLHGSNFEKIIKETCQFQGSSTKLMPNWKKRKNKKVVTSQDPT
jgi:hypothetical protein